MVDAVIVSGAGRGIGKAIALKIGEAGIPVICVSKSDNAEATRQEIIKQGGQAFAIKQDISDYSETEKKVNDFLRRQEYKRLGIILAAGITGGKGGISDSELKNWEKAYQVNLLGNFAIIKGALPVMLKSGFGRIVTFAGGGSAYAYPVFSAYSASKTAVVRATENLHQELSSKGDFSCVCLAPGAVDTDLLNEVRAAGALVKTTVGINEAVEFVSQFLKSTHCAFSGRFVHVRDGWKTKLDDKSAVLPPDFWLLRRIEK